MTLPFRVLLITDDGACARAGRGVVETLARALHAGGSGLAVLVRMKGAPVDDVARMCVAVRAICRRAGALVLVHTHTTLVARLGLDGAHIDATARVDEARIALPPRALLGASRHVARSAGRAGLAGPRRNSTSPQAASGLDGPVEGLDYVTLAPVFAPSSKPGDTRAPIGVDALRRFGGLRTVALGGIDADNARACLEHSGAIAVVGAVMSARDPARALALLIAKSTA